MSGINEQVINAEIYQIGPQGIPGEAATVSVGTVTTGAAGTDASVINSGTSSAAILDFVIPQGEQGLQGIQGPQGIQGLTGATGNGIASIEKIATVGLMDTYKITFTNNTYYDFEVINGSSISDIEKTNTSGLVDTYTITLTNGNTHTFTVSNGAKGDKGETGEVGNGILGVNKMSTTGLVDNYRMTFTNGTYFDFDVTNAKSIVSIAKISTSGMIDTYRITFNDNTNFQFPVTNGRGITGVTLLTWEGLEKTYRMSFNDGSHFDFVVTNGAGSQVDWGGIYGVLSQQTDLQDALVQSNGLTMGSVSTYNVMLKELIERAYSTFDLSKFNVVGSPVITDDGVASGFVSQTNYLTASFTSVTPTTSIEMWSKFIANNNDTNGCIICSLATSHNIRIQRNSETVVGIRGYGSGGLLCNVTGLTINNGDEVIAHATITATGATLEVWVNGVKATPKTVERTNDLNIAFAGVYIGGQYSNGNYSPASSIDLKYQRVVIDGVEVFSGNKTGIDTIKTDDYEVVGSPTISADGIASGFVSQTNYITGSFAPVSATNKVELWVAITNNSADTNGSVICATNGNLRIIKASANAIGVRGLLGDLTVNSPNLSLQNGDFVIAHAIVTATDATLQTWVNGVKQTDVTVSGDFSAVATAYDSLYIGGQYSNGNYSPASAIDINYCKELIDGNLVYQPCLKIPYTESKTGSKIVNSIYRDRVNDMASQFGSANYYTLDEDNSNFTLPKGELYGLIGDKTLRDSYYNGVTYWELFSNRRLEQGGSCESGVEYTLPKPFADANYVLTIPYSSKTATSFIPSATGDFIAKGTGLL